MPWVAEDKFFVSQIKRHFTLCFGGKGKIWLHYKVVIHFSDGGTRINQMRDQVLIEDKNGKWVVTDYISPP